MAANFAKLPELLRKHKCSAAAAMWSSESFPSE